MNLLKMIELVNYNVIECYKYNWEVYSDFCFIIQFSQIKVLIIFNQLGI